MNRAILVVLDCVGELLPKISTRATLGLISLNLAYARIESSVQLDFPVTEGLVTPK
jgi:hypothetical protein